MFSKTTLTKSLLEDCFQPNIKSFSPFSTPQEETEKVFSTFQKIKGC